MSNNKNKQGKQTGNPILLFIGVGILAIIIGVFVQTGSKQPKALPEFKNMIVFPSAKPITHTNFTDHRGQVFGETQFKGKWSVVFFGFTNCPDICPTTLQTLKKVKQTLVSNESWKNYQIIMASVDPETDTVERLSNYVPHFDDEFIGIVNDVNATAEFAKQLGILFIKRESDTGSRYEVDHSASLILINPEGQFAGVIGAPHHSDTISADLTTLAKHTGPITQSKYTTHKKSLVNEEPLANKEPSAGKEPSANKKPSAEQTPPSSNSLTIKKAWIRPAPPSATSLAAYFEVHNTSNRDITIIDSSSPAFDLTMIHTTVIEDGVARMEHLDGLHIPANSHVKLVPLGKHMMLMRPETPLRAGDSVSVTLIDEDDNEYQYDINVRKEPSE